MVKLITQSLSTREQKKVEKDLEAINRLTKKGKELGFRIIISGGYAVDGFLHKITRYHDEIDIQVYGQEQDALQVILKLLESIGYGNDELEIQDKGRSEYYHNFVVKIGQLELDIYYLQVKNDPFAKEKIIVKADGSLGENQIYDTNKGKIYDISFEIQDPLTEVVDKIYKREYIGHPKLKKHEQDIKNLKKIFSGEEIQKKLNSLTVQYKK